MSRFFSRVPPNDDKSGSVRSIQNSQESLKALANRYWINHKTVRKGENLSSLPILSRPGRKAAVPRFFRARRGSRRAFRRHTLLPASTIVCMPCRRPSPHLTPPSSSASLALQRHLESAGCRTSKGDKARQEKVQGLIHRLLPTSIVRPSADQRKEALPVPCDRPHLTVRLLGGSALEDDPTVPSAPLSSTRASSQAPRFPSTIPPGPDRQLPVQVCEPSPSRRKRAPTAPPLAPRHANMVSTRDLSRARNRTSADQAEPSLYETARVRANEHRTNQGTATVKRYHYEPHDQLPAATAARQCWVAVRALTG